jgi:hypothetical protein
MDRIYLAVNNAAKVGKIPFLSIAARSLACKIVTVRHPAPDIIDSGLGFLLPVNMADVSELRHVTSHVAL